MNKKNMILTLALTGSLCLALALYLYLTQKGEVKANLETKSATPIQPSIQSDDNKHKGNSFEQYVLDYFLANKQIKLVSKVSDYYKDGNYAEDNTTPDLKFRYANTPFAVECKYRSQFVDGKIKWAEDYQIKNYTTFETTTKQKVFVAIGIGGDSNQPKELYIVPLYRLTMGFATQAYIKEFQITNLNSFLDRLNKK